MDEDSNHIIKDEDLEAIYKLMDADKNIIKLNKKMEKVLSKVKPLQDNYNAKIKTAVVKFATENDDKFFNKVILNGGYIIEQSIIKIPGLNNILSNAIKRSPLEYIKHYNTNKAMGYDGGFSFEMKSRHEDSDSVTIEIKPVCYWTEVTCWTKFLSKSHLRKKIDKKLKPFIKLNKNWVKKSMDIAKKYFKHNRDKYQDQYTSSLLEEFESFITEKEKKIYFSDSDPRVLFKVFKVKHSASKKLNKISGGIFKSRRLNKMLLSEFVAINKRGYQAILNSDGEVVPFIDGKEIRNSLINGTYKEYEEKLLNNAEHFDEYKEIYFKKHATTEDNSIDDENEDEDENAVINEDGEDLNDEKSDGSDLK